jgi:hypothetical protein
VLRQIWAKYVIETRARVDAAADEAQREQGRNALDRQLVVVVLTVLLTLLLLRFFGRPHESQWLEGVLRFVGLEGLAAGFHEAMFEAPDRRFNQRIYWAVARLIGYVAIPVVAIRLVLRKRIRDFGAAFEGARGDLGIYVAMGAVLLPVILIASFDPGFARKYPYYRLGPHEPLWPFFIGWEVLYALQFVALEFFYRGFFIHGAKPRLGFAAVFLMLPPYLMIHFGKPLPEAVGSIIAGFALGTMSLRTGSIWGGAALHVLAGWSMDWLALWHRGLL